MCDSTTDAAHARRVPRPRWSGLYGLVVLALGALASVELLALSATWRAACECAVVLGAFGGMAMWTRRNRVALDLREWCGCAAGTITVRMISSRSRTPAARLVARTNQRRTATAAQIASITPRATRPEEPAVTTNRPSSVSRPVEALTRRRAGNLPRAR